MITNYTNLGKHNIGFSICLFICGACLSILPLMYSSVHLLHHLFRPFVLLACHPLVLVYSLVVVVSLLLCTLKILVLASKNLILTNVQNHKFQEHQITRQKQSDLYFQPIITLLTLHSLLLNLISIASTLHIALDFQENLKVICASVEANVWSQLNLKMFLRKFDALVQCCVKILHKSLLHCTELRAG